MRLLRKHGEEEPQAIANACISALDEFRDGTPITDDQTVVVVRILA
jgi:serine phosphatase RsbU (regulator of sigma subunit)